MENTAPTPPANTPKKSGKKGCLIGCLTVAGIVVVLVIIIGVVAYPYINKGIQLGRAMPMVNDIVTQRIANENERAAVIVKFTEEIGQLIVNRSQITPAVISNLVERVIAEQAEKSGDND